MAKEGASKTLENLERFVALLDKAHVTVPKQGHWYEYYQDLCHQGGSNAAYETWRMALREVARDRLLLPLLLDPDAANHLTDEYAKSRSPTVARRLQRLQVVVPAKGERRSQFLALESQLGTALATSVWNAHYAELYFALTGIVSLLPTASLDKEQQEKVAARVPDAVLLFPMAFLLMNE